MAALAAATAFPVLADPLSGARYGEGASHAVPAYDVVLADEVIATELRPTVVIRVGTSPTSASLLRWLDRHSDVPQIVIDGGGRWKDHGATASVYVTADPAEALSALARPRSVRRRTTPGPSGGVPPGRRRRRTRSVRPESPRTRAPSWRTSPRPSRRAERCSSPAPCRSATSTPTAIPAPSRLEVLGNRGASGIDGIVSTAFGVASQRASPTVCVLGDLAFFHDQNGLLFHREEDACPSSSC